MSRLDWKNNSIFELVRDVKNKEIVPTYTQYLTWSSISKRSITAVGADYQNKMIKKLEELWDGNSLPILGPDKSIPDDVASIAFKACVVKLASDCRKTFLFANPIESDNTTKHNYQIVFLEVTSL